MSKEVSIKVQGVKKIYPLYEKPVDRLKEAMLFSKKKYHKEYNALQDVSFEVYKGETFGIIGMNGAGKSTLLKLITGVAKPTAGEITVNGKVSALLELGAGFNMEYTGLQNIYLNGSMMGYRKEEMEPKVKQVMDFADIGDFINQPVKTYSSGMFARLAFAVAINVEPDILIVDEALSVGDVFFQNKCYRKFEELRSKGTTVLFVSHDISSVKQMCSRVLWLNLGIIEMIGDSKSVCDAYSLVQIEKANNQNKEIVETLNLEKECTEEELVVPDVVLRIQNKMDGIVSDKAEVVSVFVSDSEGNIVEEIQTDREYTLNIISKFYVDMKNVIIGYSIENVKGLRVLGQNTYAHSKKVYSTKAGQILAVGFKFVFPKIETGNYLISPAIAIGSQETPLIITWINSAQQIRVQRDGYNLALFDVPCVIASRIVEKIEIF